MSWDDHHSRSERLAADAANAIRVGEAERAEALYRQAAAEEAAALHDLDRDKVRTWGITAVSTVALWYKGRQYSVTEKTAYRCLADGDLPEFASTQLRDLLQMAWVAGAAEEAGIKFIAGDVLVSVKGGQVVHGGAPLDLIVRKMEGIQALLFRTVEMLLKRPFRKRGGPPADIQSMFRPWLLQAPAGSYQFGVRMQEPEQMELWEVARPRVESVTTTFFRILRASATDPDGELAVAVPNSEYRSAFLSLSRNLAPTGQNFESLDVRDASSPADAPVTFVSETRDGLNVAIRKFNPSGQLMESESKIRGVLRALDLDKDWLEVGGTEEAPDHIRIHNISDVLDDVVGPMVNRRVVVSVLRRGSKNLYRDIELDE